MLAAIGAVLYLYRAEATVARPSNSLTSQFFHLMSAMLEHYPVLKSIRMLWRQDLGQRWVSCCLGAKASEDFFFFFFFFNQLFD